MKRIIGIVLICAMTAGMVTACAPTIVVPETEPTETTAEAAVRPQDDYYRYINGDRLKNAKFEPGESSAGDPFNMEQIDDQIDSALIPQHSLIFFRDLKQRVAAYELVRFYGTAVFCLYSAKISCVECSL